ncbi:MAG: hypothetical protein ABTD50_05930 [Polyangiaceae bacterium]
MAYQRLDGNRSAPGRASSSVSERLYFSSVSRWDLRIASRAAAVGALALLVAWLVTAATDEGGISWTERSGRIFPVAPACSAVGAWAALVRAVRRGETLALTALGRRDSRIVAPVVLGAAAVSLATALAIASLPWIGLSGFYPSAVHANAWVWREGSFVDLARGIAVGPSLVPMALAMPARALAQQAGTPDAGRAAAAIATAAAGLALPLMAAHAVLSGARSNQRLGGRAAGRRTVAIACVVDVGATAALFQAAASGRTPALLAVVPPLVLLAYAIAALGRRAELGA